MWEHRECVKCGGAIQQGRLKALPDTTTCVLCSTAKPRTADEMEIDGPDREDLIHTAQMNSGENR